MQERSSQSTAAIQKPADAALLHVYGYKPDNRPGEHPPIRVRPAITARLGIHAAETLMAQDKLAERLVMSGGPALGYTEPVSTTTEEEIHRRYGNAVEVFTNPHAQVTTRQELRFLQTTAEKEGWLHVISIGWGIHKPRIQLIGDRLFSSPIKSLVNRLTGKPNTTISYMSIEDILTHHPNERRRAKYKQIIADIHASEGEKRWKAYEAKVTPIIKYVPFGTELLDLVAKIWRPKAD